MSSGTEPGDTRHTLPILSAVAGVLAVLAWIATTVLVVVDATNVSDLPDQLTDQIGRLWAISSIVAVVLIGIHVNKKTVAHHTAVALKAIAEARDELKSDTGSLPGMREAVDHAIQHPEIFMVYRQPVDRPQQVDRVTAMRVLREAEERMAAEAEAEYAKRYEQIVQGDQSWRPHVVRDSS